MHGVFPDGSSNVVPDVDKNGNSTDLTLFLKHKEKPHTSVIVAGHELPTTAQIQELTKQVIEETNADTRLDATDRSSIIEYVNSKLPTIKTREDIQALLVVIDYYKKLARTQINATRGSTEGEKIQIAPEFSKLKQEIKRQLEKLKSNIEQKMGQYSLKVTDLDPSKGLFGANNVGFTWSPNILNPLTPEPPSGPVTSLLDGERASDGERILTPGAKQMLAQIGSEIQQFVTLSRLNQYLTSIVEQSPTDNQFREKVNRDHGVFAKRLETRKQAKMTVLGKSKLTIHDLSDTTVSLNEEKINLNDFEVFIIELGNNLPV